MAGKVLNIKTCCPLKLRSGLTGNYPTNCHYSYNLPLSVKSGGLRYLVALIRQRCKGVENLLNYC